MRRFLPDSLTAWALLILIGGLAIAEVATLAAILQNRVVATRMTGFFHLAERVSSVSRAIAGQGPGQRAALATALSAPTMIVSVGGKPLAASTSASDGEIAEVEDILQARLAEVGITEVDVQRRGEVAPDAPGEEDELNEDAGPVERFLSDIEDRYVLDDAWAVSVQLQDESWVNFVVAVSPGPRLWSLNTVALTALVILLVLAASLWALRRLTAPYALLAQAAERLGRDLNAAALPENGPREVRAASHAFNLMQARLQRFLSDRDQLVAAISHDLRTPATRLRLRAEFVEDADQRTRMLGDLDDIETMTRSVLAFASDSADPEPREWIDLVSLLQSLCDDLPGATLELSPDAPARLPYSAQRVALRRCVANILENAVKYGGVARVSLQAHRDAIRILVDDDGPGIPDAEHETAFRPFRRLEPSRNRGTGGTGLGLTIARSVARAHGGDVTLANSAGGGLRVAIIMPMPGVRPVAA